ncbi:MAG: PHP domain-containing protein [Lachnospiraceae bacterium]|jgi:histidinol phosphatase-like PHP family hydrolase|nr:PHP domain-containing protein [Lachnospiraceae bacterium]
MEKIVLPNGYGYFYDTHIHTTAGSACAKSTPIEVCEAYKALGYTGLAFTDHNWGGNTSIDNSLPWPTWVAGFTKGYRTARKWGEKHDFDVFWGYEAGYDGTEFLILGLEPEFLLETPALKTASVKEQRQIVKAAGGIVIHAHPFRAASYIPEIRTFPFDVDAVEGFNSAHNYRFSKASYHQKVTLKKYDTDAVEYALDNGLPITAGSDSHNAKQLGGGGMAFMRRPESAQDLAAMIRTGKGYRLTDGIAWYDEFGKELTKVEYATVS